MFFLRSPEAPTLHLHPDDAAAHDFAAGSRIEIKSRAGSLEAILELDRNLRRGVVSIAPGWFDANVGQLTSSYLEIDPLTGQPPMTGIGVRLAAAQPAPIVFSKSQ